jgi:hypothetical protein
MRKLCISVHAAMDKNALGTKPVGLKNRHGRMYSKSPCFVRGCRDNAASVFRLSTDNNRLSPQLGIIKLLYRGKKSVEVYMKVPVPGFEVFIHQLSPISRE